MILKNLIGKLLNLDGRRLGYLEAAEFLEWEFVSGDIGEAQKELRSERLNDMLVPEDAVLHAAEELRQHAEELKVELDRMEGVILRAAAAMHEDQSEETPADDDVHEVADSSERKVENMEPDTLRTLRSVATTGRAS